MEISISVEELAKRRVMVATPCYGGQMHGLCAKSFLDLQNILNQHQIENRFSFLFNESLITRARNYLCDEFLRNEQFTHLLFIDSDIHFNPLDVVTLLAMDKDVSGGPYPKKTINWTNIKRAIVKNQEVDPGELDKIVGDYVFNPVAGTVQFNVTEPIEVMEIGTGYMMIKREVFKRFEEAYPMYRYKPDHAGQENFDGSRYITAFFDTIIDSKDSVLGNGSDRYLSEDYFFCQMVRKLGVSIWLCPWMQTKHCGTYPFSGDLISVANLTGTL